MTWWIQSSHSLSITSKAMTLIYTSFAPCYHSTCLTNWYILIKITNITFTSSINCKITMWTYFALLTKGRILAFGTIVNRHIAILTIRMIFYVLLLITLTSTFIIREIIIALYTYLVLIYSFALNASISTCFNYNYQ